MKERVGDGKLMVISIAVSDINIDFFAFFYTLGDLE